MKVKKKISSKAIIAIFIAITMAFAVAFSVVYVLAAGRQSLTSDITISYRAIDIKGSVAMYAKKDSSTAYYTAMEEGSKVGEFNFDVDTDTSETPANIDLSHVQLSKQEDALYLHYVFTNLGDSAYTATLNYVDSNMITQVNIGLYYSETGTEGSYQESDYGLVVMGNSTKHYYVMLKVEDLAKQAEFVGDFKWDLVSNEEDLSMEQQQSLAATSFTVMNKSTNTYSAKYNGEDISVNNSGTEQQSFAANSATIENIWYVPASIGNGVVAGVEKGKDLPANTKVIIPETVTKLRGSAFYNQEGLVAIELPSTLKDIGNYAFYRCINLTSIVMPASLEFIGFYAFEKCANLVSVDFGTNIYNWGYGPVYNYDDDYIDPEGWTSFEDNNSLQGMLNAEFGFVYGLQHFYSIPSADLSDVTIAARYLKTTYKNYTWKKMGGEEDFNDPNVDPDGWT